MNKIDIKLSETRMLCECSPDCCERATMHHHEFSNSRLNRKLYGKLIDHDKNVKLVNHDCHNSMPNISELVFCKRLGIEPRSKVLKGRQLRI